MSAGTLHGFSPGMTATLRTIASAHICLNHQYGCRAFMTWVTFVFAGVVHRARRFVRADMPDTGKIELYTIPSYPGADYTMCSELGWYESVANEDWLGYVAADPQCRRDRIATVLVESAITGNALAMEQEAHFAAIEMV